MSKHEYGDGFLYGDDLVRDGKWVDVTVTIRCYVPPGTIKAANGKTVDRPCVGFEESPKLLSLCNTNERCIRLICGSNKPEKWIGNKITLMPSAIDAFGEKNCPVVRIRVPPSIPTPFSVRKWLGKILSGKPVQQPGGSK